MMGGDVWNACGYSWMLGLLWDRTGMNWKLNPTEVIMIRIKFQVDRRFQVSLVEYVLAEVRAHRYLDFLISWLTWHPPHPGVDRVEPLGHPGWHLGYPGSSAGWCRYLCFEMLFMYMYVDMWILRYGGVECSGWKSIIRPEMGIRGMRWWWWSWAGWDADHRVCWRKSSRSVVTTDGWWNYWLIGTSNSMIKVQTHHWLLSLSQPLTSLSMVVFIMNLLVDRSHYISLSNLGSWDQLMID